MLNDEINENTIFVKKQNLKRTGYFYSKIFKCLIRSNRKKFKKINLKQISPQKYKNLIIFPL